MKTVSVELNEWELAELLMVYLQGLKEQCYPENVERLLPRIAELNELRKKALEA